MANKRMTEDAPANAAGLGGVAGLGVGPNGEPGVDNRKKKKKNVTEDEDVLDEEIDTFTGTSMLKVDLDTFHAPYRTTRYVGADELAEGLQSPVMQFVRRKPVKEAVGKKKKR